MSRAGRIAALLPIACLWACASEGPRSSDGAAATEILRIAPEECPPDPVTGEDNLWTDPDTTDLNGAISLELQGCESPGDGWATLEYVSATSVDPYHLVEVRTYEGGGWIVVNSESRVWTYVRGRPVFAPDGRWAATAVTDLEAEYRPNHRSELHRPRFRGHIVRIRSGRFLDTVAPRAHAPAPILAPLSREVPAALGGGDVEHSGGPEGATGRPLGLPEARSRGLAGCRSVIAGRGNHRRGIKRA